MADTKPITLYQAIVQTVAQVEGPISVDEVAKQVLAIRPSKAKNPVASIRSTLRTEHQGDLVVFLDRKTLIPLRIAMRGIRFRIPLTRREVNKGALITDPAFQCLLPRGIVDQGIQLIDNDGRALSHHIITIKRKITNPFGSFTEQNSALDLSDWFRAHQVRRNDCILVTIEDWEKGHCRLQHEPAGRRQQAAIEQQNHELAALLYEMLENARDEQLYTFRAIPTAYALLSDPRGYPGDHWIHVIANDPRMTWDGFTIRYSDSHSFLDMMLDVPSPKKPIPASPTISPQQAAQVYRFKAWLWHRPGLWRRIDLQGGQTLADFDRIMRDAFLHDFSDHLGGFWRLVRRGKSNRFRQVEIGTVDPLGDGEGADQRLAELDLQPGDDLKYVYDFGDWIEHRLTLEAIIEPESDTAYPRIVEQNKPHYKYCPRCRKAGRKSVADWVCIECSNMRQKDVLLCESCMSTEHADHYVEEMLY